MIIYQSGNQSISDISKPKSKATFFLLFILLPFFGFTQIVNIESQRSNAADTIGWNGQANAGFTIKDNGKNIMTIESNLRLEHIKGRHLFLAITDFNFGKVDNSDFQNDGFQHFRYNYTIKHRFVWEAFTQLQYNERINLKVRYLLGSGPRFGIIHKDPFYVYAGILYMYEYDEEVQGEPEVKIFHRDHRMSSYLSLSLKPLNNLAIYSTSYYQPVLTNFKDLRLSSKTTVLIKITDKLNFSSSFNISYDSRAPEGIQSTIYGFSNGLSMRF